MPTLTNADPPDRCPFHSRALGCRCDLKTGHEKLPENDPQVQPLVFQQW